MDRRKFIQTSSSLAAMAMSYSPAIRATEAALPYLNQADGEIDLVARPMALPLLPSGPETNLLCFEGSVLKGPSSLLKQSPGFLGPTIEVKSGQRININFKNELHENSVVHWHGLHLPEAQDGHPSYAIPSGQTLHYSLHVTNRAGLYWYHPHPHGRTGYQVYQGLAGLFVVRDEEEEALNLPKDDNELFAVIQDRDFDENNQLVYIQSGRDIMMGKTGLRLFVNGELFNIHEVKQEWYRLRLLNGSNARTYRLQWSDGSPIHLIGTDGGLLEERVDLDNILLSPGERLDILVDLSKKELGEEIDLLSIPIVENTRAQPYSVYALKVSQKGEKDFVLPTKLSSFEKIPVSEAVNTMVDPKKFTLLPMQGVGWTIDGLKYEMGKVREKETVKLGTTEIWEFELQGGMLHPLHIHGSQFQVLERINGPHSAGLVFDGGWKDTVPILPFDRVKVIKRFHDFTGNFLYHCHVLEHEDHSMMRDFRVVP